MAKVGGIQESFKELSELFHSRMAELQLKLNEAETSGTTSSSTTEVESELSAFRSFVLKALDILQTQVELVVKQVDDMEMRSRRKMLVVHGVKTSAEASVSEDTTSLVVENLKSISNGLCKADTIQRCHRLGKPRPGESQPILVKFRDITVRDKLWFGKTALKDSGITVGEFLTKPRQELFAAARERFGVRGCWSWRGDVFVLNADGGRQRVTGVAQLIDIPVPTKTANVSAPAPKKVSQAEQQPVKRSKRAAKP